MICIISCGAKKIWNGKNPCKKFVPACEAYTGSLFRLNRAFAEKFYPGAWYIISDKYGIISPGTLIENYEISPKEVKGDNIFKEKIRRQLLEIVGEGSAIVNTCGKIHEEIIISTVETACCISNPVRGLTQGMRMKRLSELLK